MTVYLPVLTGETVALRTETESFISGDRPDVIQERVAELDAQTRSMGAAATFGAEVELQFIPDPNHPHPEVGDKSTIYEEIIKGVPGYIPDLGYLKGWVIAPGKTSSSIMRLRRAGDRYDFDDQDGILEVRTAPADALTATERYWNVIASAGRVAARRGLLAMVMSTHFSAAVITDLEHNYILDMLDMRQSADFIAATQHNITAMRPLHLDAGLGEGFVYTEAFPTKDATTAIHRQRLEFRQPTIGITDPRLYTLGVLSALDQSVRGTVPRRATRQVHECRRIMLWGADPVIEMFDTVAVWDVNTKSLVLPAQLYEGARGPNDERSLNQAVARITGNPNSTYLDNHGQIFRDIISGLCIEGDEQRMGSNPGTPYAARLGAIARGTKIRFAHSSLRTMPHVVYDSPEGQALRRPGITHSRTVRTIFGKAVRAIASVGQARERRQALIDSYMVVSETS